MESQTSVDFCIQNAMTIHAISLLQLSGQNILIIHLEFEDCVQSSGKMFTFFFVSHYFC